MTPLLFPRRLSVWPACDRHMQQQAVARSGIDIHMFCSSINRAERRAAHRSARYEVPTAY